MWNLPPFNPLALAKADYEPFAEILRANMRHAKVLRIDHILGLSRQFWVPRGASGADGAYVTMPLERLLAITAAESVRAKCLVIGEDLGTVPEGLRERLSQANILSYRVLWFEQDAARFQPPESYPQGAAVCLSSHDLAPFKGWRESASQGDIAKLESAIAEAGVNTVIFSPMRMPSLPRRPARSCWCRRMIFQKRQSLSMCPAPIRSGRTGAGGFR